ncbi:toxin-antitoxin system YwqK family antitoxin [Aquimarina pacifica]|uniref:toxin-antitoxin system YwqK family antitoxin n=1 Tax=Aquimarina pacifica TaxID=1296415 RepID=UPI0004713EC2|nr:hypothetical protein [Aquimarina pacifica]
MQTKTSRITLSYAINNLGVLLLFLVLVGCHKVEKTINEVKALQQLEITYDDYDVEFDQYNRSVYVDKNRDFMSGHYFVMYNNKVSEEFIVKGGLLDKLHKTFSPQGHLSKEVSYKNGYRDGTEKSYNKEGLVVSSAEYSKGKKIGDDLEYTEDGKALPKTKTINGITYTYSYHNGKLKMTTYLDKIDGIPYEIMLFYDHVETLQSAFAVREYDDPNKDSKFYILTDQLKISDSIDPKKEPEKMMKIYQQLQQ